MHPFKKIKDYVKLNRERYKPGELLVPDERTYKWMKPFVYPCDWQNNLKPEYYQLFSYEELFDSSYGIPPGEVAKFLIEHSFIPTRKIFLEDILFVVEEEILKGSNLFFAELEGLWNPYLESERMPKVKVLIEDQLYWAHPNHYVRYKK